MNNELLLTPTAGDSFWNSLRQELENNITRLNDSDRKKDEYEFIGDFFSLNTNDLANFQNDLNNLLLRTSVNWWAYDNTPYPAYFIQRYARDPTLAPQLKSYFNSKLEGAGDLIVSELNEFINKDFKKALVLRQLYSQWKARLHNLNTTGLPNPSEATDPDQRDNMEVLEKFFGIELLNNPLPFEAQFQDVLNQLYQAPELLKLMQMNKSFIKDGLNRLKRGAGDKFLEMFNDHLANPVRKSQQQEKLIDQVKKEYQEFQPFLGASNTNDQIKITNNVSSIDQDRDQSMQEEYQIEKKEAFVTLKIGQLCNDNDFDKDNMIALFEFLELPYNLNYNKQRFCADLNDYLESFQSIDRSDQCDNPNEPVGLDSVNLIKPSDLIKITYYHNNKSEFGNNDQSNPTFCFSANKLIVFQHQNKNMANWVQNEEASMIMDADGMGGKPGNGRYRMMPGDFKHYITQNSMELLKESNNQELVAAKYDTERIGNVSGSHGISESHGQNQYPVYILFKQEPKLNNKYLLGPHIGRGFFGKVNIAFNPQDHSFHAIKFIAKYC